MKHKGKKYQFHYHDGGDFMDDKDDSLPTAARQKLLKESKGLQKVHAHKMANGYHDIMKD